VHALQGHDTAQQLQQLRDGTDALQRRLAELQTQLDDAFRMDDDGLAAFASTAQAEGVSLPVARRLLAPLLAKPLATGSPARHRLPSVARLGRWSQDSARRAAALLPILDAHSRPRVEQAAPDEIFFGKKPCLMVVEQHKPVLGQWPGSRPTRWPGVGQESSGSCPTSTKPPRTVARLWPRA